MIDIQYSAPPTLARFMRSNSFGRMVCGPVGSGKTTAVLFELFRRACEQRKSHDGFRYTRYAVLRQTLKQLKDTVLKDVTSWLRGICEYRVSESTVYIEFGDVKSEWLFLPLENPEDRARLLSMQLTGAWLSEAIEMDVGVVPDVSGRCGRYPGANLGGASWSGIVADTNAPPEGSEWFNFMTEPPPDWEIYFQPSGLSPEAENLEWLNQTPETLKLPANHPQRKAQGRKYYERLSRNQNLDWVKRYVHGQFGDDPSGSAVFKDSFKRSFHVVENLEPVHGYPIIVGQDFGRDPWSIICQPDHKGRLLVLEEVPASDIGLELHVTKNLRPALFKEKFIGRPTCIIGDPAGASRSSISEETSFDCLKRLGFVAMPAPTNNLDTRIRAVEALLLSQRDGGPSLVINGSRCPKVIRALDGGYRYGKTPQGIRKPKPEKNEYSHCMDALQYACLVVHGGITGLITSRLTRSKTKRPPPKPQSWT